MGRRETECPHCGGTFPEGRIACPHCGADAETGWLSEEDQELASVDLSFTHLESGEYEHFLATEGLAAAPAPAAPRRRIRTDAPREPVPWLPIAVVLLVVAAAVLKTLCV